jgi:flagellin
MVSSINYYLSGLADIYNQNSLSLSKTLMRLASGKNFQTPSDDLSNYFRSQNLDQQYRKYERIRPDMQEWKGVMDLASTAGGEVYNSLERMQELSSLYDAADAPTKATYTAEYNQILSDLTKTVNTTYYGSTSLLNQSNTPPVVPTDPYPRLKAIDLVPDPANDTQRMLIAPGEAVTAAHILELTPDALLSEDIGDVGSHITAAITDVKTFLGNVSAYSTGLQSHLNITASIMQNTQSVKSSITDIDQIQEMIAFTQQDIRSQTSLAMIAQANMSQRSMLYLYGMHT